MLLNMGGRAGMSLMQCHHFTCAIVMLFLRNSNAFQVLQLAWVARFAVPSKLQFLAPLHNVLALRQRLDMVEPAALITGKWGATEGLQAM